MKKLWTGHKINPLTYYVNIWPPSVTLEEGDRFFFRMTHCLIIVNNNGKYLQNPFIDKKVMERTRHIPSNRQCWHWMSKCDLDPGSRGLIVAHGTSSYYNKHLWQILLINDKVMDRTRKCDGRTDGRTEPILISPLFSSKRRGTITHYDRLLCVTYTSAGADKNY
jgi:hypothetical protein